MNKRLIKWGSLVIIGILILSFGPLLFRISNGHIIDYVNWRWMVTFNRPVQRIDDFNIVVTKSDRKLRVYQEGQQVAEYPIALSQNGLAPRETWEDSLTPEGEFLIASMQYASIFGPRQMLLDTTQQSLSDYVKQMGMKAKSE